MNIRDESHRRRLLESAKNLPSIHPLDASDGSSAPASVGEWLSSINLAQYEQAFMVKGCRDMNAVRKLSVDEIKPVSRWYSSCRSWAFVSKPLPVCLSVVAASSRRSVLSPWLLSFNQTANLKDIISCSWLRQEGTSNGYEPLCLFKRPKRKKLKRRSLLKPFQALT